MKDIDYITLMLPWVASIFFLILTAFCSFIYILQTRSKNQNNNSPRPPGPWGLPLIGHLHMLGNLPHRSLHKLSQIYGPIMQLRLGFVPTVVVSSPQAAELFLKIHDLNFAGRPKNQASQCISYGSTGVAFTQYGSYWRDLRKVCTVHLLSVLKMESFMELRKEEVGGLVRSLKIAAECGELVNISGQVGSAIEKISFGMIFGSSYQQQLNFKQRMDETTLLLGAFNIADYIPFFKPFDLQGLNCRMKSVHKIMDDFQEKLIHEHESDTVRMQHHKDFIDVMLSLMKSDNEHEQILDRNNMKAITLEMLGASMDTTSTAVEWVLTELLRNPPVMEKVQEELTKVVGLDRMVEESDLAKLIYLDMVVKETMRLHPDVPLLLPHESLEDMSVGGYYIPKGSRIIVNAWAIGRHPNAWSDNAEMFYPERFTNNDIDVRGHHIQLIPFGAGRRKCPGIELGLRTIHIVLAQLLHAFKLELPSGMSPKDVDMQENFGLTMPRANPLVVVPIYRLSSDNI